MRHPSTLFSRCSESTARSCVTKELVNSAENVVLFYRQNGVRVLCKVFSTTTHKQTLVIKHIVHHRLRVRNHVAVLTRNVIRVVIDKLDLNTQLFSHVLVLLTRLTNKSLISFTHSRVSGVAYQLVIHTSHLRGPRTYDRVLEIVFNCRQLKALLVLSNPSILSIAPLLTALSTQSPVSRVIGRSILNLVSLTNRSSAHHLVINQRRHSSRSLTASSVLNIRDVILLPKNVFKFLPNLLVHPWAKVSF